MSLRQLPSELYAAVVAHLPPSDLCAVALVDKDCRAAAQRRLFRHISAAPALHALDVVYVLARTPALAALVRSFWLSIPETDDEQHESHTGLIDAEPGGVHAELYAALGHALAGMTTLHSLTLLIDPRASSVLARIPAQPDLSSFTSTFPLSAAPVLSFLGRTPALLALSLDTAADAAKPALASPGPALPPGALPRLESFTGAPSSACALLPGRPVDTIHLLCGAVCASAPSSHIPTSFTVDEHTLALLAALSHSTAPGGVHTLSLTTSAAALPVLEALSTLLPALVDLRVGTSYAFDSPWDADFYDRVAELLAAMPRLSTFELSGMCWPCARCAGRDDSDAAASAQPKAWRPTNLPLVPAPPQAQAAGQQGADRGGEDAQGPPEDLDPVPEFDFHDYLF